MIGGVKVGISICEDVWSPTGPLADQAAGGAELNININGSPYHFAQGSRSRADAGNPRRRCQLRARLRQPGVRAGRVGVRRRFDGVRCRGRSRRPRRSVRRGAVDHRRAHRARVPQAPARSARSAHRGARCRWCTSARPRSGATSRHPRHESHRRSSAEAELYEALVLGTGDYVRKNGFTDVVIGLSGGIDSTLVACIAVDALGAEHVHGVSMPSRYSSDGSKTDAADLAAGPRHRLPHDRHRAGLRRLSRHDRRSRSPASPPISPRRTCRAGSAGPR